MCKQSHIYLSYFHTPKKHKKSRKNKYWYFCPNKKSYDIFITRKAIYRNPASVYRSRRERKTNTYPKVFRIADIFADSRSKMLK